MKKILILILSILVLVFGNIPAFASNTTISGGNAEAKTGETVDVYISMSDNTGFSNISLEIGYNSNALTLIGVENYVTGTAFTTAQTLSKQPYNMQWDSVSNTVFNGNIARLSFIVNVLAEPGSYPITVNYFKGVNQNNIDGYDVNYDENYNSLNLSYVNGSVTVSRSESSPVASDGSTRKISDVTVAKGTEHEQNVRIIRDHISYNYNNAKIGVTSGNNSELPFYRTDGTEELTVMLIKGNYEDSDVDSALLNQSWEDNFSEGVSEIYYVGQTKGRSIAEAFVNLGVKDMHLPMGEYTMICGSENNDIRLREKIYIGDSSKMNNTDKYYSTHDSVYAVDLDEDDNGWDYSYACVSDFPDFNFNKCGWLLQYVNSTSGQTLQMKMPISNMTFHKGVNLDCVSGTVSIGFQMNNVPCLEEDSEWNFVAIPYKEN